MNKIFKFSNLYLWFMFAVLYLPIFYLIFYSFNAGGDMNGFTGFTLDHYTKVFKGEDSQPTMSPEEKSNLEKRKLRAWRVLGWNGFIWITIRIVLYKTGLVAITEASEVIFLILYFISFYIVLKLVERAYDL
mgnify:CR=1 FL=1